MKKPKNAELNEKQKAVRPRAGSPRLGTRTKTEENQELSKRRIYVEHIIRTLKIFRCAQERFRLNKKRYTSVILTICGLVRLRIGSLILKLVKKEKHHNLFTIIQSHSLVL